MAVGVKLAISTGVDVAVVDEGVVAGSDVEGVRGWWSRGRHGVVPRVADYGRIMRNGIVGEQWAGVGKSLVVDTGMSIEVLCSCASHISGLKVWART